MNIIVGSTRAHARAMVGWYKLKTSEWQVAAYGEPLYDKTYQFARIIRPLGQVEDWQIDWILETLVPTIEKTITPIPLDWNLNRDPEQPRKIMQEK